MITKKQAAIQKRYVDQAQKHFDCDKTTLVTLLGVPKASLYRYETGLLIMPVEIAIQIEKRTKGAVKRHVVRPDIFDGYELTA